MKNKINKVNVQTVEIETEILGKGSVYSGIFLLKIGIETH